MQFIKQYQRLKRRKTLYKIVFLIKLYRVKGSYNAHDIRCNIIKNHCDRKSYLRLIAIRDSILINKEQGASLRVRDILERL